MANIGNLAIVVSANSTQATAGLQAAADGVTKLGSVAKAAEQQNAAAFGGIEAVWTKITALGGKVSESLGKIALIGGAFAGVAAAGKGFLDYLKAGEDGILAQYRAANRLGITMKEAAGLQLLGGDRSEELEKALAKFEVLIGEARGGSTEAKSKLSAAGIESLAGAPMQLFKQAIDNTNKLGNATDRAATQHELFGKSAHSVADILNRGSGAFDKAANSAERYGLVVSEADARTVMMSRRLEGELAKMDEARQRKIAAAVSPYKGAISESLTEMFSGNFNPLINAIATSGLSIGHRAKTIREEAGRQAEAGPERERNRALEDAVSKTTEALQKQIDTFGMSGSEIAVYELKLNAAKVADQAALEISLAHAKALQEQAAGHTAAAEAALKNEQSLRSSADAAKAASQAATDYAKALDIQLTRQHNQEKREQEALGIANQTQSPYDKFQEQLQNINQLKKDGLLTDEESALAIAKQVEGLQSALKLSQQDALAPALTYGSKEAIDSVARFQSQQADPQAAIADLLRVAVTQRQAQIDLAQQLARALENVQEISF